MTTKFLNCSAVLYLSAISLVACSNETTPKNQKPVEMAAGLYSVTLGGKGAAQYSQSGKNREEFERFCLNSSNRHTFPQNYIKALNGNADKCTAKLPTRKGNRITGEALCNADSPISTGTTYHYSGDIYEDGLKLGIRMEKGAYKEVPGVISAERAKEANKGAAVMNKLKFELLAKRIGDC